MKLACILLLFLLLIPVSYSIEYKIKKLNENEFEILIKNDDEKSRRVRIEVKGIVIVDEKFSPKNVVYEKIYLPDKAEIYDFKVFVDGKEVEVYSSPFSFNFQIFSLIISFLLGFFFYLSLGFLRNLRKIE